MKVQIDDPERVEQMRTKADILLINGNTRKKTGEHGIRQRQTEKTDTAHLKAPRVE